MSPSSTPPPRAEEIVQDGVNGWVVAPDAPAIAGRLLELGEDRARLATMGAAARKCTEPYAWERVVDRYEALYDELVGDRSVGQCRGHHPSDALLSAARVDDAAAGGPQRG